MDFYYITFRSVTYAQRGERLLQEKNLRCRLLRTPKWMEEQGCGYCLRLRGKDVQQALALLRQAQIPLRKVYFQSAGGDMEQVAL